MALPQQSKKVQPLLGFFDKCQCVGGLCYVVSKVHPKEPEGGDPLHADASDL